MAIDFNKELLKTVHAVRLRVKQHNIGHFNLEIEAEGDTDDIGSTLLKFKLSKYGYGPDEVSGNDLHAVTAEFIRRHGWQQENDAKLLPNREVA